MRSSSTTRIDEENQTVSFTWKDYNDDGRTRETTLPGAAFIRRFTRHLVPQGLRRIRYFGLLCRHRGRITGMPGAPSQSVAENHVKPPRRAASTAATTAGTITSCI